MLSGALTDSAGWGRDGSSLATADGKAIGDVVTMVSVLVGGALTIGFSRIAALLFCGPLLVVAGVFADHPLAVFV